MMVQKMKERNNGVKGRQRIEKKLSGLFQQCDLLAFSQRRVLVTRQFMKKFSLSLCSQHLQALNFQPLQKKVYHYCKFCFALACMRQIHRCIELILSMTIHILSSNKRIYRIVGTQLTTYYYTLYTSVIHRILYRVLFSWKNGEKSRNFRNVFRFF